MLASSSVSQTFAPAPRGLIPVRMESPAYCRRRCFGAVWSRSITAASGSLLGRVGTREQVAQCSSFLERKPDLPTVLEAVVAQMATLAQGLDVTVSAATVRRIVVKVGGCEHHLGHANRHVGRRGRGGDLAVPPVTPDQTGLVPPPAIAQVAHCLAMRPATDLTLAAGAHESDPMAYLGPVDRVEIAQLPLDRHGLVRAQASKAAVRARGRWR